MLLAGPAQANGDPQQGKAKSTICASCHGPTGAEPIGANPIIAGQHHDYLLYALRAYANGDRQNAVMAAQVAPLTDADLQDLAAYYAAQSGSLH